MDGLASSSQPTAQEHADSMVDYFRQGEQRALALGNRGPIRLDQSGDLHPDILAAYREHGFYVFQDVIGAEELGELRADVERMLAQAPVSPDSAVDKNGQPAFGQDFTRQPYRFAKLTTSTSASYRARWHLRAYREPIERHSAVPMAPGFVRARAADD